MRPKRSLSTLASIQWRVIATGCWPKAQLNPSAGPSSQLQLDKATSVPNWHGFNQNSALARHCCTLHILDSIDCNFHCTIVRVIAIDSLPPPPPPLAHFVTYLSLRSRRDGSDLCFFMGRLTGPPNYKKNQQGTATIEDLFMYSVAGVMIISQDDGRNGMGWGRPAAIAHRATTTRAH